MVNARIKILGIAPYEGMRTVMERRPRHTRRSSWISTREIWRREWPLWSPWPPIPMTVSFPEEGLRK